MGPHFICHWLTYWLTHHVDIWLMQNCRWPACEAMMHLLSTECLSMVVMPSNLWLILPSVVTIRSYLPNAVHLLKLIIELCLMKIPSQNQLMKPMGKSYECNEAMQVTSLNSHCMQPMHVAPPSIQICIQWANVSYGLWRWLFMYSDAMFLENLM